MALEASIRGATEDGHNNDSDRGCLVETLGKRSPRPTVQQGYTQIPAIPYRTKTENEDAQRFCQGQSGKEVEPEPEIMCPATLAGVGVSEGIGRWSIETGGG